MGSLFNNGSCCGNNTAGTTQSKSKCNGCVCELLNQLANARTAGSLCTMGQPQMVDLVLKGTNEVLDVGQKNNTHLTLLSFDPETCCAVFSFEPQMGNRPTQTIVIDCRCICAVICVPPNNNTST